MILWRVASTSRNWQANDLSGAGAAQDPGRWNDAGQRVVYAAPTLAMGVLETAAHVDDSGLPLNKYVVRIEVPDNVWDTRKNLPVSELEPEWNALPSGIVSVRHGSSWYEERKYALLEVPSVIVPEESVILINAEHPDASRVAASAIRRYEYNLLFRHS